MSWSSLLLAALASSFFPAFSSSQATSAGLGQEFNTSAAQDGSSVPILISPSGNFVLSFSNEGESAPPFYTLIIITGGDALLVSSGLSVGSFTTAQIWGTSPSQVIENNCTLRLETDGNLVLQDYSLNVYWQSNSSNKGVVSMALLDTGNLVLLNATNGAVWQSFDYPSDALVLGQSLRAGVSALAQGPYSLQLYEAGVYLFYTIGATQLPYWQIYPNVNDSSADTQALGVAEVGRSSMQLFARSNNSALVGSIQFPAFDNVSKPDQDHSWWLLQLGIRGFLEGSRANSSHYQSPFTLPASMPACAIPNSCIGPYDDIGAYCVCYQDSGNCSSCPLVLPPDKSRLDSGCSASSIVAYPNCSTQEQIAAHRFLNLSGFSYFALAFNISTLSASLEDCTDACLRNCSCKAAFYVTTTSACLHVSDVANLINVSSRTDHLAFIKYQQQMESVNRHPTPAPTLLPAHRAAAGKIVLAVSGAMAGMLTVIITCYICRRKWKGGNKGDNQEADEVFLGTLPGLPPRFSYEELRACTDNFSRKLGAGGFGAVFAGVNPRDRAKPVAVKVLASKQGSHQFQAEIATIQSVRHINLVRLHGFCVEGTHRLLVYELMSNGSLDAYLRKPGNADRASPESLPWPTRLGIALGAARGLAYLHNECRERIIHCDIKPENILLNHRLEPAISDFGPATLMSREQSYAAITMRGTLGYLAPELLTQAPITEKSDVYSYGMVLLELVSGRRLFDSQAISQRQFLPTWALSLHPEDSEVRESYREIIDERLRIGTEEDVREMETAASQVVAIALLCSQKDPDARPTMAMVVKMLQGDVQVPAIPPSPTKPVLSHISPLFI